jgi:hypothetical protein
MAMNWIGFVSFLCIIFARSSVSLYFHMGETEKKCFIEEIPDETMVTGQLDNVFLLQESCVQCTCLVQTALVK